MFYLLYTNLQWGKRKAKSVEKITFYQKRHIVKQKKRITLKKKQFMFTNKHHFVVTKKEIHDLRHKMDSTTSISSNAHITPAVFKEVRASENKNLHEFNICAIDCQEVRTFSFFQ